MSADKTASSSHQHSQEELAISHASQQTISQDMRSSPTVDQASNRYGARNTLLQLLLFITILYVAYVYNPQLEPSFLLACGSALLVLLVVRNLLMKRKSQAGLLAQPLPKLPAQSQDKPKFSHPRTPNLSGVWVKDKAASDSMEATLQLMQVNRLIRTAVRLVKGMELRQGSNSFEIIVLSGILWFKITEHYPLTGEVRCYKRRDLRKGLHRGTAEKLADGAICVTLEWDEPLGGIGTDVFYVPAPGLLYVDSTIFMRGKTLKYRTIYNKQ